MATGLKKRYSLPDGLVTHLFEGEISDNSFGGLHSEAVKSVENGNVRVSRGWPPGQLARRSAGKPYWANVSVRIDGAWYGPGLCSFFPLPARGNPWDKATLIRMIEQSLTAPVDTDRSSREEWTSSPRAMRRTDTGGQLTRIRVGGLSCIVKHQTGHGIASVYPFVEGAGTAF